MRRNVIVLALLLLSPFTFGQNVVKYVNDGILKCKIKDYSSAISVLNKAINIDQDNSEAYYFRGVAKFEIGDYRSAISDFSKALDLNPNKLEAYYDRGIAKNRIGDYLGARNDFNKAKEINPSSSVDDYRQGHKPDFTINDTLKLFKGFKQPDFLKMFAYPDTISYVYIGGKPIYSNFEYYNKTDTCYLCFRLEELVGFASRKNGKSYSRGKW